VAAAGLVVVGGIVGLVLGRMGYGVGGDKLTPKAQGGSAAQTSSAAQSSSGAQG
jgi:hypothetical protein